MAPSASKTELAFKHLIRTERNRLKKSKIYNARMPRNISTKYTETQPSGQSYIYLPHSCTFFKGDVSRFKRGM